MPASVVTPVVSYEDGPKLTVNALLKNPTVIPRRIIDIASQMFIADQLLRGGDPIPGGAAIFFASNPLFADTVSEVVNEFGTIPVGISSVGNLSVAVSQKRGLGVVVSREEADRNAIDVVNLKITQTTNTLVRDYDSAFMAALVAATVTTGQTAAASYAWSNSSAQPRSDINLARSTILNATLPGESNNFFGFRPDTLVISMLDWVNLLDNANIWTPYVGDMAHLNPQITGKLPDSLFGLDTWATWNLVQGTALVMERNTVGFISDERPLQASPMSYREDTEHWRSNVVRSSAIGIDQPYAVAAITGIG
jgi:hypothetical protein